MAKIFIELVKEYEKLPVNHPLKNSINELSKLDDSYIVGVDMAIPDFEDKSCVCVIKVEDGKRTVESVEFYD